MGEYYSVTYSESLSHHGILGQKWGTKNGPPYPLGAEDHSAREKKAGWRKSLDERSVKRREKYISKKSEKVKKATADLSDLEKNGVKSEKFKRDWGDWGNNEAAFRANYGFSREEALKSSKRATKNKLVRASYKKKMAAGENLTDEERALRKKDQIKKAIIIAGVTAVTVAVAYKMIHDKEVKAGLSAMYLEGMDLHKGDLEDVIKEGFEFHRMTGWEKEKWDGLNRLYVSGSNVDRDIYKGFLRDWHKTGERFELTIQAAKDLKVAGTKKQMEVFEKMLEDNDFFDEFAMKFDAGYQVRKARWGKDEALKLTKNMKGSVLRDPFDPKKYAESHYKEMIYDIVKQDSTVAKKYLKQLESLGYDVVVDDFDRGTLAYRPLIVINPQDVLKQVGATKISEVDMADARSRVISAGAVSFDYFSGLTLHDAKELMKNGFRR